MQWNKIWEILCKKKTDYLFWLIANLGGIIIAYFACLTIWIFHKRLSNYLPSYEVFLINGTISLAVSGVSYIRLKLDKKTSGLSPLLVISWPFLLMLVYGVLISIGLEPPAIGISRLWIISLVIFISLMFWSSIMWLHEQGIKCEEHQEPPEPPKPKQLDDSANGLPKV